MVGDMRSLAVMAASASRLGGEGTVDTSLDAFARAMTGNVGKAGKGWNEFIRGTLGIKEGTTAEEAMPTVFAAMQQAESQGRSLMDWLKEMGLGNVTAAKTLVGMYNDRKSMADLMRTDPEAMAQRETPQTAAAGLAEAERTRQDLRQRRANAQLEAAKLGIGMRNEVGQEYLTRAEAELTAEGRLGPFATGKDVYAEKLYSVAGGAKYEDVVKTQRAIKIWEREHGRAFPYTSATGTTLTGGKESDQKYENYAYASSGQFFTDINAATDAFRLGDTSTRRLPGWDAQPHTQSEMLQHARETSRNTAELARNIAAVNARFLPPRDKTRMQK